MRALVDITHPAHVHLFKHVLWKLQAAGDPVLVTSREKDVATTLLDALGIEHVCLSRAGRGLAGLAGEWALRCGRLLRHARRFRPDVMLALNGVCIAPVGALLGIPRVVLEEAEHARLQRSIALPLATHIMTGTGYLGDHGARQRRFRGIWVQAYLDPRYFTPAAAPLREAGLDPDSPYIVVRLVAWKAAHDAGLRGTGISALVEAVEQLSSFGRVLISSEGPLPEPLLGWRNPVPAEHVHDLLAFAALYLGEGGTMAAEAGVLGTPAIFCSPLKCGYLTAMEQDYGLVRTAGSIIEALPIARELLVRPGLGAEWQARRKALLDDSQDVVEFMYDTLVEAASRAQAGRAGDGQASRPMRWVWRLVCLALTGVILFFVGRALYQAMRGVPWDQARIRPHFAALAMLCLLLARFVGIATFQAILGAFGAKIDWLQCLAVRWVAALGRYVPGKVAAVAGASGMLVAFGVRLPIAVASSLLLTMLSVLVGIIFSVPLLMKYSLEDVLPTGWVWAAAAVLLTAVYLHPRVFMAVTNAVLRRLGRRTMDTPPRAGKFLLAAGTIFVRFCLLGLAAWLTARAITDVPLAAMPVIAAGAVFASVVGFLAFFTPAGFGVRDGLHLLIFGSVIGPGPAALVTVLLRLLDVVADLATGAVGAIITRGLLRRRNDLNQPAME